jgi:hypothetical protein
MDEQQKKVDLAINMPKEVARAFTDNVNMAFNEEFFLFVFTSGNRQTEYALTPKHAKRLLMLLERNIRQYEEKLGVLDTRLPSDPVLSPFQTGGDQSSNPRKGGGNPKKK